MTLSAQEALFSSGFRTLAARLMGCEEYIKVLSRLLTKDISINLTTETDYLKLGQLMLARAERMGSIKDVLNDTSSVRTFYKRAAAVRYYTYCFIKQAINEAQQLLKEEGDGRLEKLAKLSARVDKFARHLPMVCTALAEGFVGQRAKRKSKRLALAGLPQDWQDHVCRQAAGGKYALPTLVLAVTGCRPAELQRGVRIRVGFHDELQAECLFLHIDGVKVREKQGQPERVVAYKTSSADWKIQALIAHLKKLDKCADGVIISVKSAANFSAELVRMARILWPTHRHKVSAICYRHQIAADVKKLQDGDSASRVLGHRSAKTRKYYGTSNQGRSSVVPDSVQVTFPLEKTDSDLNLGNDSKVDHQNDAEEPENS